MKYKCKNKYKYNVYKLFRLSNPPLGLPRLAPGDAFMLFQYGPAQWHSPFRYILNERTHILTLINIHIWELLCLCMCVFMCVCACVCSCVRSRFFWKYADRFQHGISQPFFFIVGPVNLSPIGYVSCNWVQLTRSARSGLRCFIRKLKAALKIEWKQFWLELSILCRLQTLWSNWSCWQAHLISL